jgi:hypothetical protein
MWPRVVELMLGVWLVLSPWIFRGTASIEAFAPVDIGVGGAVIVLSLLSFWRRTEWAHLVTAGLAAWMGLVAYFAWPRPGPPGAQNELTLAMLLVMFAIMPNEANTPPRPWRREA